MRGRALLLAVIIALWLVPTVYASPRTTDARLVYISNAYYTDLDGDSCPDDIKILVEFAFGELDPSRVAINLWIILPSGVTYTFKITVYRPPDCSTLQIDCMNMAYESGWYTIDMSARLSGTVDGRYVVTDTFAFDPPTGGGPGLPTVNAYF